LDPLDRRLSELREQLTEVDRKLVALVARRQDLASRIGSIKRGAGVPTRDYAREKDVLELAESAARDEGVPADVVRSVMQMLIRASLTTQERARVSAEGRGAGRRALVIGGAGKMGSWFREFLASQGYAVTISDPAGPVDGYAYAADWRAPAKAADLVVIATSLGVTARLLRELADVRPRGLVFDIGSLKTPLKDGLSALGAAGCRVASIHPMFGPDTRLLSGRHVIFVDAGNPEATAEARELFASTMAEQVEMELEEHDRLIAFVLGLSHALNLAFFSALAESGEGADRLARLSSTTFDAQLAVASTVARESPALYFEIQALNEYGDRSLEVLGEAVRRIRDIVREGDEQAFAVLMENGRRYLESRV
jgi:chorismate mutase/prephenate dehydrogenase